MSYLLDSHEQFIEVKKIQDRECFYTVFGFISEKDFQCSLQIFYDLGCIKKEFHESTTNMYKAIINPKNKFQNSVLDIRKQPLINSLKEFLEFLKNYCVVDENNNYLIKNEIFNQENDSIIVHQRIIVEQLKRSFQNFRELITQILEV